MTSYEHMLRGYPVRTLSKNLPTYHQVDINYPYNADFGYIFSQN
jgi:hypothetical protein